ncbi:RNB domain-containing ribonuclease [Acaryochloris thomasi]|nr:RNB domain-containing ribonuclease [Acaryochloris thomasi]
MWIEETDTGATIQFHIIYISDHIPINSPLDRSAIATTQTRYHRQGNSPMLPRILSEESWEGLTYTELSREGHFLAGAEVYVDDDVQTSVSFIVIVLIQEADG